MHARPTTKTPAGGRHRSTTTGRWRSAVALLLLLPTMAVIGAQAAAPAAGADVCPGEQVELTGETKTITYTAPEGYLVSGWCVKAGPTIEVHDAADGHGHALPAKTVTITHSSGKGVSHYSVTLVKAPEPKQPTAPTSTDVCEPATGPTNDRITIPSDANFTYTVDGVAVAAGQVVATGTTHVVMAVPKAGVVVKEGATTKWTFTFTKVACVTPPPPPPPVTPPVTPPVVTPPPVVPPVVAPPVVAPPEVLPEQAFGKAVGSVKVSCQGTVRARLVNRSGDRVSYTLRVGTKVHRIAVRSQSDRRFVTRGKARAVVVLKVGPTRLDRVRIPALCQAPEALPDTGVRPTSS